MPSACHPLPSDSRSSPVAYWSASLSGHCLLRILKRNAINTILIGQFYPNWDIVLVFWLFDLFKQFCLCESGNTYFRMNCLIQYRRHAGCAPREMWLHHCFCNLLCSNYWSHWGVCSHERSPSWFASVCGGVSWRAYFLRLHSHTSTSPPLPSVPPG